MFTDSVGFRFREKHGHMAAKKMLHLHIALLHDYTFKDFTTNEARVVSHDAGL